MIGLGVLYRSTCWAWSVGWSVGRLVGLLLGSDRTSELNFHHGARYYWPMARLLLIIANGLPKSFPFPWSLGASISALRDREWAIKAQYRSTKRTRKKDLPQFKTGIRKEPAALPLCVFVVLVLVACGLFLGWSLSPPETHQSPERATPPPARPPSAVLPMYRVSFPTRRPPPTTPPTRRSALPIHRQAALPKPWPAACGRSSLLLKTR